MEISNVKQKKMLVQLLLFSMIMSVSYLIVEIFFINQSLIKIKNGLILSPAAIEDIELQARVISGVGLGLFIFSYIVNWDAKKFKRGQSLENASSLKGYIQKFVFIMLISVPLMYGIQAFYVSKIETFTGFKKLVAERLFKQGIAQVDQSHDKPLSHALTVAKASMTAQNTDAFYAIDHDDLIAADKILADSQTVERYEAYKTLHTLLISYHAIINNMYSLNSIVIQNPPEELKAFNQTLIDLDEALTVMYAPYSQMQDYVLEEMFKRFQKRGQYTRLKLALAKVRKYPKNSKPYRKYRDLAHDQLELSAKPFHKTRNFIYYGGESVLENGVICSNFRCPSERVVFNNILKANNYKTQEELVRTVLEANDKVSIFAADKCLFG
ncbi:hypothetical protein [Photobacterium leiognathi]|uniref:hypothetical protein n=1 Tax=Photobacterium leiognathi TaxID=553611 RepID=UPI002980E7E4|nr:hypothetical protein [Photobacterium leiognathi]